MSWYLKSESERERESKFNGFSYSPNAAQGKRTELTSCLDRVDNRSQESLLEKLLGMRSPHKKVLP